MKKVILILIATMVLVSCDTKEDTARIEAENIVKNAKMEALDHSFPHPLDAKIEWNNPALMGGNTNFGAFFVAMFRHMDYDRALLFTSKGSVEKFGAEKIKEVYANFEYNYSLYLVDSKSKNDTIVLGFSTNEYATGKIKHMKIVIENDTCKLILANLSTNLLK